MLHLPGESHYVTVDGISTHYLVSGEGSPLLLFHGLGSSVVTWRDNIAPLSEHFRVYAFDLPGHGDSDKPDIDYLPITMVDFVGKLIHSLNLGRVNIVGNSIGGALSLMVALKYPELVSSLVLASSAGLGKNLSIFVRLVSLPLIGNVMESSNMIVTRLMLMKVFHDDSFITHELLDELHRSRSMPGAKNAVLRVLRRTVSLGGVRREYVLTQELSKLEIPVLLVWGAQDEIIPVSHGYGALEAASNVRLEVFDECGHWPHMEKAEAFNSLVSKFLSG